MPARKAAQLSCPMSAGTDTKAFVTGALSWIISTHRGQVVTAEQVCIILLYFIFLENLFEKGLFAKIDATKR